MRIVKEGLGPGGGLSPEKELEHVNRFAKIALTAEEVYVFSLLLCDNEVDRDFERFTVKTLEELRELFVGRTGISDHRWEVGNQKARIYRTELVTEPGRKNSLGEPYAYLKGYAYMLRTENNAEIIAEIEGGIKKETSVGCSVSQSICSICHQELGSPGCSHIRGREYDGKLCFGELTGAVDAYEWSFVAVPAQRSAGVLKKAFDASRGLRGLVECEYARELAPELERLEKEAAAGRMYLEELRRETLRLGLLCGDEIYAALEPASKRMEAGELRKLVKAFERQLEGRFTPVTQLPGRRESVGFDGEEYRV